jgi:hypothetical protein
MSLEVDGKHSTLGSELADNLWVRPAAKRRASARR